ncbi:MAG: cytochrome b562 [Bdellovibrionota bacterium]
MKLKILLLTVLTAASTALGATNLGEIMKGMSKDLKLVGQQISKPELNASSLAALRNMQSLISQGINEVPEKVAGAPDQEAQVVEYKKAMTHLLETVRLMEDALVNNDNAKAAALMEKLGEIRKAGHEKFKKP